MRKEIHFLFDNPVNLSDISTYASVKTLSGTPCLNGQNNDHSNGSCLLNGQLLPK